MPNSASRILEIVKKLQDSNPNKQLINIWAELFGIELKDSKDYFAITKLVDSIRCETEIFREEMRKTPISENLYLPAISRFEGILSPMILHENWNNHKNSISHTTAITFGFCSEILTNEEEQISEHEINEITGLIDELEGLLNGSQLPLRLQKLIVDHVALIRQAIAEYPISGSKALKNAFIAASGDLIVAKDTIQSNRDTLEVSKLANVWDKVIKAAEAVIKAEKVYQIGQEVIDTILQISPI